MLAERKQHLLHGAILLVALTIPLSFLAKSIAIILLTVCWLFVVDYKTIIPKLIARKLVLVWIVFFLVHVVSYWYSANKIEAASDLEMKLSFLIFPIVIGAGMNMDRKTIEIVFIGFIIGVSLVSIYYLSRAISSFLVQKRASVFFYNDLIAGNDTNAVHIAWHVVFSLIILLFFKWHYFLRMTKGTVVISVFIIQFIFFILLSARLLLILFFLIVFPIFCFRYFKTHHLGLWQKLVIGVSILSIVSVITFTQNPIRDRFENILHKKKIEKVTDGSDIEARLTNLTLRLFIWKTAWETIRENKLWLSGTGCGDVHIYLNKALEKKGIPNMHNPQKRSLLYNINIHNMYLHFLFMLGIGGLALFVILVFGPFFIRIYPDNLKIILILYQITSAAFMFQESALETQAGIVFFCFFQMIFINRFYAVLEAKVSGYE